jgi:hypothetical protein
MYKIYTMYRPNTGEIVGWIGDNQLPTDPEFDFIESPTGAPIDGAAFYVVKGRVEPRPASPAQFGDRVLFGLPVPCQIVINGTSYQCYEPAATIDFTYKGTYSIAVRAFPYQDANFQITT